MKYRKKPVVIEAIKWNGTNVVEVYNFLENEHIETQYEVKQEGKNFYIKFENGACKLGTLMIKTLEGEHKASIGDYIIKGVDGEFYPCKPDIFEKTYEVVEDANLLNSLGFKNFKLHADSTLKRLTKDELVSYIHMLHHNWSVTDEQVCNAIEANKKLDRQNDDIQRSNMEYYDLYKELKRKAKELDKALDKACYLIEEDRGAIDDWKDYEEYSSWKEWCMKGVE